MAFQTCQIRFICWQTATSCNDRFVSPGQFVDDPVLPFAESRLAVMLKDFLNRRSCSRFDHIIGVEKCKTQDIRYGPAYRGFSGSHETNQGEIANLAGAVHTNEITKIRPLGTQILGGAGDDCSLVADLVQHRLAAVDHLHFVVNEIFFRQRLHHRAALIVQPAQFTRLAVRQGVMR